MSPIPLSILQLWSMVQPVRSVANAGFARVRAYSLCFAKAGTDECERGLGGRMSNIAALLVMALTVGVLAFLIPFAFHRTLLLVLSGRNRFEHGSPWPEQQLPHVTVQLPIYNERHVVSRLIDAVCRMDYPAHLLEVQVLDDSDDVTSRIVDERVAVWQARGVDIVHITRGSRDGFKAGALAEGTSVAKGEFLLVLDADFVSPPGLLRDLLPPFQDASVGMVQARWDHLNRHETWFTEAQALLLDGHFLFEQGGRHAGDRFFNFNGTAGVWRRKCLEEAGGWHADTLTEDLDLSYRAQMAGWRFAYLDHISAPAEIPSTVEALEVQQRRWAQGGIQTARKILPTLLRGPYPFLVKAEAVIHLCGHVAHPLTWALALLLFPSAIARRSLGLEQYLLMDVLIFGMATVPFMIFYWQAGARRGQAGIGLLRGVARTLALGIGLSIPVSRAVFRGLADHPDPFVRTAKTGDARGEPYPRVAVRWDDVGKSMMAALMATYLALAIAGGYWGQLPFILLFLTGYTGLAIPVLRSRWRALRVAPLAELSGQRHSLVPELGGIESEQYQEGDPEQQAYENGLRPLAGVLERAQPEISEERKARHQDPWPTRA